MNLKVVDYILSPARTQSIIEDYVDDELVEKIYAVYDGESLDYGGGVIGITVNQIVEWCDDSPHTLNKKTKIGLSNSKNFLSWCHTKIIEEEVM